MKDIADQFANSQKINGILTKQLEQWKREHGELLINKHENEQELIKSKLECKRLVDEFEAKFIKASKDVDILKKQCRNLSQENGDLVMSKKEMEEEMRVLKGKLVRMEEEKKEASRREKEARDMCEKLKECLEKAEKCKKEEVEKSNEKNKKAEDKLDVVMIAATDRYNDLHRRLTNLEREVAALRKLSVSGSQPDGTAEAKEQRENFAYDEVNEMHPGSPPICETTVHESIPRILKSAPVPPPIFEITDSDDDEDLPMLKGIKRKLLSSEVSHEKEDSANSGTNRSKQLKGLGAIDWKHGIQGESGSSNCWEYEADLLEALDRDTVVCMKAICTLYRQRNSPVFGCKSLNALEAVRVSALAEFLINGDAEGRLKRSGAELEKFDPNGFECRKIAFGNATLLFHIYKSGADPFFAP